MNISHVSFGQNYFYNQNNPKEKNEGSIERQELPMPTSAHYAHCISFTGGKSLSLKETCESLITKEDCPPLVWERAQEILDEGNPENKTLIDVHKEVYQDLNEIDDMEMLKFFFPQFENVKSSFDIEKPKAGSFLDSVKKGENKYFNPKNDTTIDLIRLLYADGFSTSDLKEYCDGKNVATTVTQTLNIPLLSPKYARILKLSDPVFNERLTSAIANTRMLNKDKILQSDEPVYIPSKRIRQGKPLSDEHKAHISEGLREYWENNPDRAGELSQRQKEYFEENPEQRELFSKVLIKTWKRSPSIKKALSKFFRKNNIEVPGDDDFAFNLNAEQKNILKDFWKKNVWARELFSKNMKAAWVSVKKEIEDKKIEELIFAHDALTYKFMPNAYIDDIIQHAKENGIELTHDDFTSPIVFEGEEEIQAPGMQYISTYMTQNTGNILADTYTNTLGDFVQYADNSKNEKVRKIGSDLRAALASIISQDRRDPTNNNLIRKGELSINEAMGYYCKLYIECNKEHLGDCTKFLKERLEVNYTDMRKDRDLS